MNVAVAQSGGPTGVINASLLGVYKQALQWPQVEKVYGFLYGIEGILQDRPVVLNDLLDTPQKQEILRQTPSAALRSCRYKLPCADEDVTVYERIRNTLDRYGIEAFFYIGGNDSMDTVDKLSAYLRSVGSSIRVMGVPKTIDNDLVCTDHTPGYGSAAKFVATSMAEIIRDCTVYDLDSVTIVEIMGRDTGWLTAAAALPRLTGETAPHLIYLPEVPFSVSSFVDDVRRVQKKSRTVVVAVSEGVCVDTEDSYQSGKTDTFGHRYLSGIGKYLEQVVQREIGCKVRSVELNILQRCAAHILSLTDVQEAQRAGAAAVDAAMNGMTGGVVIFKRTDTPSYSVEMDAVPVSSVANRIKYVPREWMNESGNDILTIALEYIRPLVIGELPIRMADGMPEHFCIQSCDR